MIADLLYKLNALKIVLGSSSPRRQELLRQVGLSFEVIKSAFPEDLVKHHFKTPNDYVRETAWRKLSDVRKQVDESRSECKLIIGGDTIVVLDGIVLEKPANREEAKEMLTSFSGRKHEVISSCLVFYRLTGQDDWKSEQFEVSTWVTFASLPESLIDAFVDSNEPYDKSGGYGAQGVGGSFIESIEGDYNNVVGLPLQALCARLRNIVLTHFLRDGQGF